MTPAPASSPPSPPPWTFPDALPPLESAAMNDTSSTSTEAPPANRFVLRDLPLSARLVLSLFLLSVGLGYFSALVQIHFRHAGSSGEPLPSFKQVVEIFHGDESQKKSPFERMIEDPPQGAWPASMVDAFFNRAKPDAKRGDAEREGERKALVAWVKAGAPKEAYTNDAFPLPADWNNQPITKDFLDNKALKVRSILETRCVVCHNQGNAKAVRGLGGRVNQGGDVQAQKFPLENYDQVAKYTCEGGGPKMSLEALTQSTHAHLLSFSMLWALTGLIFALTRYPGFIRFLLAPLVLLAQIADVSFWWLARLPGPLGEQFAMAIVITGGIVGAGLALQIVLSLFDMYDWAGRVVLVLLFVLAGVGGAYVYQTVIVKHLADEKTTAEKLKQQQNNALTPAKSRMEAMIEGPANGNWPKNMAPAFFGKGKPKKPDGDPEREGERKALIAWIRAGAPKKAYDEDALPVPDDWGDQKITPSYRKGDTLSIRSIIKKRCVECHAKEDADPDAMKYPLETYDEVMKFAKR
jgi:hypothetical protein